MPTAPRTARATKNRRHLEAVKETEEQQEAEQVQQQAPQQEEQPQAAHHEQQQPDEQQGEQLSPRARRRSAAATKAAAARSPAANQPDEANGGSRGAVGSAGKDAEAAPVLTADAALVDMLAEQMFAALEEFTNQQRQGESSSESEPDEEGRQQPSGGAAQQHQPQDQEERQQDGDASSSDNDSSGSEDEDDGSDSVPPHLRWQPELVLPGQAAGASDSGAATRGAAAPAGVHVVRRGKDGLHVPPPDERLRAKAARKERPDTAGKGWFDLPATQVTDEVKNDLRMLRLRCEAGPEQQTCAAHAPGAVPWLQTHVSRALSVPHHGVRAHLPSRRAVPASALPAWSSHPVSVHLRRPVQGRAGPQGPLQEAGRHQVPKVLPDGDGGGERGRLLLGWATRKLPRASKR